METVAPTSMIFASILGLIIGLAINLIPTIIAFVKGNLNKIQVLLLNILPWGLSIITAFIFESIVISIVLSIVNITIWIIALVKAIRGY